MIWSWLKGKAAYQLRRVDSLRATLNMTFSRA